MTLMVKFRNKIILSLLKNTCSLSQLRVEVGPSNGSDKLKSDDMRLSKCGPLARGNFCQVCCRSVQLQLRMQNPVLSTVVVCCDSTQWRKDTHVHGDLRKQW